MRKLAVVVALLGLATPVWALEESQSYSRTEGNHTSFEHAAYELMFNNSGSAMTSGTVVILDRNGTGVNNSISGSSASRNVVDVDATDGNVDNEGTYITTTTTADSALVAGVTDDDSCADQTYCRVQVYGPRLVRCANTTDVAAVGAAVGTTSVAGQCGGGNGLGVALTPRTGQADNNLQWIFIRVGGNL